MAAKYDITQTPSLFPIPAKAMLVGDIGRVVASAYYYGQHILCARSGEHSKIWVILQDPTTYWDDKNPPEMDVQLMTTGQSIILKRTS